MKCDAMSATDQAPCQQAANLDGEQTPGFPPGLVPLVDLIARLLVNCDLRVFEANESGADVGSM